MEDISKPLIQTESIICSGYGTYSTNWKYTFSNNFQKLDHEDGWPNVWSLGQHNSEPLVMHAVWVGRKYHIRCG